MDTLLSDLEAEGCMGMLAAAASGFCPETVLIGCSESRPAHLSSGRLGPLERHTQL